MTQTGTRGDSARRRSPRRAAAAAAAALLALFIPSVVRAQCTGCARASFAAPRLYPVTPNFQNEAFGFADFDGDGNLDLVEADGGSLLLLHGTATGVFGPPVRTTTGFASFPSLVTGDFDGDGRPDVFTNQGSGTTLLFFKSLPNGQFQPPVAVDSPITPFRIASGDFDGDGLTDLAVVDGNNLAILIGDGNGSFRRSVILPVGAGAEFLTVSDLNQDGVQDLIVSNTGSETLTIVMGSSSGIFSPGIVYPVGGIPLKAAVGELNGGGYPDIAVPTSSGIALLFGTGGGNFVSGGTIPAFVGNSAVAVGDFDGDGKGDIFLVGTILSLFSGDGSGGFSLTRTGVGTPQFANGEVIVGDFNRDGSPDVAAGAPGGVTVYLSTPARGLDLPPSTSIASSLLATADFNSDSIDDVVVTASGGLQIWFGDGSGGFTAGPFVPLSLSSIQMLGTADVDSNGKPDLIVLDGVGTVTVLLGLGNGAFASPRSFAVGSSPVFATTADMNGDGKPDLLVANSGSNSLSVLLGLGDGNFQPARTFSVGSSPVGISAADFDGDGKMDLVVATSGSASFSILFGDGSGGFRSVRLVSTPGATFSVVAADFDGDGRKDVAVLEAPPLGFGNLLGIYRGDGAGGFTPSAPIPADGGTLFLADFNSDGFPDIAVSNFGSDVGVSINDGAGGFLPAVLYAIYSYQAVVGDFNGDGRPDFAFTSPFYSPQQVTTFLNTNCSIRHLAIASDVAACASAGTPLQPPPAVSAIDDGGNVVACATGSVAASLAGGSGPPGASVTGGPAAFSAGIAAFTDLVVSPAGTGYRIEFDSPQGRTFSRVFDAGSPTVMIAGPADVCVGDAPTYSATPGLGTYAWTVDGNPAGGGNPIVVGGLAVGIHQIAVMTSTGRCTGAASEQVTVHPSPSSLIHAATAVCPASTGNAASVANAGLGATYSWTITNGTITSGAGTPAITFVAGASGSVTLQVTVQSGSGCASTTSLVIPINPNCGFFFTVPPCRVIDTRAPDGPLAGPPLLANSSRTFAVQGVCGIPATARAITANVTVTQPDGAGDLRVFPTGIAPPTVSTINYRPGQTRANNAVISLGDSGEFTIQCDQVSGSTQLIIDVSGYFE